MLECLSVVNEQIRTFFDFKKEIPRAQPSFPMLLLALTSGHQKEGSSLWKGSKILHTLYLCLVPVFFEPIVFPIVVRVLTSLT